MSTTTLRAAVNSLREELDREHYEGWHTDRFLANKLRMAASVFIRRETNLRKLLASSNLFTAVQCLQMEEAPLGECCSYSTPCTIARSVVELPKLGDNIYGPLIQGVWSVDRMKAFIYTSPPRYANMLKMGMRKVPDSYWIFDDRLYISDPNIELVTLSAYFEEDVPLSLISCDSDSDTCPPNPLDEPFKCPGYLVDVVLTKVKNDLINPPKGSGDRADDDME